MASVITDTGQSKYTQEAINKALFTLVACGGSARMAGKVLADEGFPIPWKTLQDWKTRHSTVYNELRDKHGEELEAAAIREMRETILAAGEAERLAIEKAYRRLAADDDHDPAKSAQYLSKVKENNVNKMLALSGRPEKVTEQRNVNQILRSLNQLGIRLVPDGHAIEEGKP